MSRAIARYRRAVLRIFVRLELFDDDQAARMLRWPHSGFHLHDTVWVPQDDRSFATRRARYWARNPVTLERLTHDASACTTFAQATFLPCHAYIRVRYSDAAKALRPKRPGCMVPQADCMVRLVT